jgi:hypothetical protein
MKLIEIVDVFFRNDIHIKQLMRSSISLDSGGSVRLFLSSFFLMLSGYLLKNGVYFLDIVFDQSNKSKHAKNDPCTQESCKFI